MIYRQFMYTTDTNFVFFHMRDSWVYEPSTQIQQKVQPVSIFLLVDQ